MELIEENLLAGKVEFILRDATIPGPASFRCVNCETHSMSPRNAYAPTHKDVFGVGVRYFRRACMFLMLLAGLNFQFFFAVRSAQC